MSQAPALRGEVDLAARVRWLPRLWVVLLGLLMLGPALAPGYVLSYDMVWVPHLAVREEVWGLGTLLPRNVPSDALVSVANLVLPGMLLQKLVLIGAVIGAGLAGLRFGGASMVGRITAGTVYLWNPFVVERLAIGHWPLLISYAVLPILITAGERFRRSSEVRPVLLLAAVASCLTPSAGVMAAVVLLVIAYDWRRFQPGRLAVVGAIAAGANAPWVAAGLAHLADATSTGAGASVFGLQAEGTLPAPLAALGLGGIWNADVVPYTRTTPLAWIALLLLIPLSVLGVWLMRHEKRSTSPALRHIGPDRDHAHDLMLLWVLGFGLALLTWISPSLMGWIATHVPGGGIMRDGARWLGLCAPLGATAMGMAGVWMVRASPEAVRVLVAAVVVGTPLITLPDAAYGVGGSLRAVHFPAEYADARSALDRTGATSVLVLPFTAYRAPAWNHERPVLDPLPRYLSPNPVASDQLSVDGKPLDGESARAAAVRKALATPHPEAALRTMGLRYAVIDLDAPGRIPTLDGIDVFAGRHLRVIDLGVAEPVAGPNRWARGLVVAGWLGWAALLSAAVATWWRRR